MNTPSTAADFAGKRPSSQIGRHVFWQRVNRFSRLPILAVVFGLTLMAAGTARAQTYTVIYNFFSAQAPTAGVTIDRAGNLYGTAAGGGTFGYGIVFRLAYKNSSWLFTPLYNFQGGTDGELPTNPLTIGPDGGLYGTTTYGGVEGCEYCGVVFKVTPPPTRCRSALCPWSERLLYRFTGGLDGSGPAGPLLLDASGNIYGTTILGGTANDGTVFNLTASGGSWTESVLHNFNIQDGTFPNSGVISDSAGNLYGTALSHGPYSFGSAYELSPSGSGWDFTILHGFMWQTDGGYPLGGVTFDSAGNLFGTTAFLGPNGGGTAFELSPESDSWSFSNLYSFTCFGGYCSESPAHVSRREPLIYSNTPGPRASLLRDTAGNLYGTTASDGAIGCGSIFELSPTQDGWTYTTLHEFTGGDDGCGSSGSVAMDSAGNLYGTAGGGALGNGLVWEIAR